MKRSLMVTALVAAGLAVHAQEPRIVIAVGTLLDGTGGVVRDTRVVVQGGRIAAIDPKAAPVDYDLRGATMTPGWIDTHVHINWHFGPDGRADTRNETPQQGAYAVAANAGATLMAGFTTVQSLGAPDDKALRDAINAGEIPGPRILTALRPISD